MFSSIPFDRFDFSDLDNNDFVYCDPPYFNSVASYNEQGVKFVLSNNLKYENPLLDKWKDKYKIHYLNGDYSNCNYQKKDKSKDVEVLITNY